MSRSLTAVLALCLFTSLPGGLRLQAQDAIRPSLAGEAAAEARRQTIDNIPYNLVTGPVRYRFGASFGVEYNDNINYADEGLELEDVILRPQLTINALWPVTQLNTLRVDLGIGYSFYLDHDEASTNALLLSPGSQISFDVFVGDFRINFHDRFSLQQDPIAELQISNAVDYGRFQNSAGVSVLWDLNKVILSFGYDHYNYIATTEEYEYLDRCAEMVTTSAFFALTSATGAGLEASFVYTVYDQMVLNDNQTYSIGGFVETQITSYMKLRLAGGFQQIMFDSDGTVRDMSDYEDFYVNALLAHRLNSFITHALAAGHEGQLGINSNYIELNYVRHTISWNVLRSTLLTTEIFYEEATDSGGFINEELERFGGAITVGYQLTPHVTLGFRYQYTQKDSNVPFRDYEQNRVSFDGTYSF